MKRYCASTPRRPIARRRAVTIGLSTEVLLKTGGRRRRAGQTTPPAEALREERQFAWASAAFSHLTGSWVRLLKQQRRETGEVAPRVQRHVGGELVRT